MDIETQIERYRQRSIRRSTLMFSAPFLLIRGVSYVVTEPPTWAYFMDAAILLVALTIIGRATWKLRGLK